MPEPKTKEELEARNREIGRPTPRYFTPSEVARANKWDAQHPAEKAEYQSNMERIRQIEAGEESARISAKATAGAMAALAWSGASEHLLEASKNPWPTAANAAVKQLMARPRPERPWMLVMHGPVGTGKTAAGYLAMRLAAAEGATVAVRTVCAVMRLSSFGQGSEGVEFLQRVELLLLDDLGVELLTEWGRSVLDDILVARYEARSGVRGRRTVITSNLDLPHLRERLGPRVMDRISDGGLVLEVNGESLRKTGKPRA